MKNSLYALIYKLREKLYNTQKILSWNRINNNRGEKVIGIK